MITPLLSYHLLIILHSYIWSSCTAARILGIFPLVSRSHFTVQKTLMKGLAARGHSVTVLSFFNEISSDDEANYTSVAFENANKLPIFIDTINPEEAIQSESGIWAYKQVTWLARLEKDLCDIVYSDGYVQRIIREEGEGKIQSPDLLVVEQFLFPCLNILAEKLDIPLVNSLTLSHYMGADYAIGNPRNPSYSAPSWNDYGQTRTFYQRLINSLHYVVIYAIYHLWTVPIVVDMNKMYIGNEHINADVINRRTSLVLYNNHFSFLNRPTVPNSVDVGGLVLERAAKLLPEDIKEFIEGAKDGVIFFSFGSSLKMSGISKEKVDLFRRVFADIPQRVLWRSDAINITNAPPSNVMIRKWFPQRDILEHENVKAFISHGGISGIYEAIETGTPVVGIPFLFDQCPNINTLQEKNLGIRLHYDRLDYDTLKKALNDIVNDRW